jgi:hypothetical protein
MKGRGQLRNLRRATNLKALIDRPGVAAGFGDQRRDAYVAELHRIARGLASSRSPMLVNLVGTTRVQETGVDNHRPLLPPSPLNNATTT